MDVIAESGVVTEDCGGGPGERLEMEMLERELCEEREEQAIEEREDLRRRLGELEGELALLQDEQSRLEGSGLEDLVRCSLSLSIYI